MGGKESKEHSIDGLTIAKEKGSASWYCSLGDSYYSRGDYQKSAELYKQAISIAREGRDKEIEAYACYSLGGSYYNLKDFEKSAECAKQALGISKEVENKEGEAVGYCALAESYEGLEDYQASIQYANQALSIANEVGNRVREARAYRSLSRSYYSLKDYTGSTRCAGQALSIAKEVGNKLSEARAYNSLAWSYYSLKDYAESTRCATQATSIAKNVGDRETEASAYRVLTWSYYHLNDYQESTRCAKQVISIAKEVGDKVTEADAYRAMAMSYDSLGDQQQSVDCAKEAERIDREVGGTVTGATVVLLQEQPSDSGNKESIQEELYAAEGGISSNSSVPIEIKARGPKARLAYENALKSGKVRLYRARIMLIGQDRAGKTSLKNSFLGLPFDPNEQSTDGIKVDPSKFEIDVNEVKNWQRTDEKLGISQFANDLARIVAEELQEEKTKLDPTVQEPKKFGAEMILKNQDEPKEITSPGNQVPTRDENSENQTRQPAKHNLRFDRKTEHSENRTRKSFTSELKFDPSLPSEEFTRLLVQHLKGLNLQSDATEMEQHLTLDLWDFAGQQVYYASHPVFFSPRAVYLLVYSLSKGLRDTAQPCVRQGNVDIHLANPNNETNLENLLSWLVSVSTMCSMDEIKDKDLPYLRPPVFIVGTHADKPFQDIKEIELQIQKAISGKGYDGHVIRPLFSVDNTQGSSGDGVGALQKRMIEVLKQEPYMGEEVPLRWLNFEKVVETLVAEKTYYLQLEQLQTIIQKVCFIDDENEVSTMLDFYHDLGKIVKHRSMVVLRAQWLTDVLRQLITIPPFKEKEPRYAKLWKKVEDTGVLSMELVDHLFSKFCQQGLVKQDILNMMEQFGLLVKFSTSPAEVEYFVPALLKSPPGRLCKLALSPSDPSPLYVHFLEGFVPHGLYSHLVSRCTRWCSERGFKQPPYLFDGASVFVIDKVLTHHLIFVCKKRLIKIILKHSKPGDEVSLPEAEAEEVASLVRGFLVDTLDDLSSELSWLSNLKCELCVLCPNCSKEEEACSNHGQPSCTHEDCLRLLKILPGEKLGTCANCFCEKGAIPPSLKKWFAVKDVRPGKLQDDVHKVTAPGSDKQSTNHGSDVFSNRTSQQVHPSLSGTLCSQPGHSHDSLKVALLASEWGSSKGGLSTMNRTLAILFAKQSKVEVTLLVPQFSCSEEDKRTATSHNVAIREAACRPGYKEPLDWLSFPPKDLAIDVILGHGAKLGKQAQFIRESHGCKWVQVVHTAPEELGMYKNYPGAIAQGEEKKKDEVALCRLADLVVAVGPKLAEAFLSYLRSSHQHVFQLTPGTFLEFSDVEQAPHDSGKFRVLTFGRGDFEDFSLKGYDIAARAIVELKESSYHLIFVGAPSGKQDEVAEKLLQIGISKNQLYVRRFVQSKDELKNLFCEVDLAIMPSRTEGFGLTGLEAMSAGLPFLVSGNSGFGETLCSLPFGRSVVVESEDPKEWAKAISTCRQKGRAQRLQEVQTLRTKYEEKFSWETQCQALVDRMRKVVLDRDKMCTT